MQESDAENDTELCDAVNLYLNHPLEFPDEEEPDASIAPQNSVEMIDEDIPSSAGNLVLPSMGGEASSGVTSSGPVKLADLQRILSNIGSSGPVDYRGINRIVTKPSFPPTSRFIYICTSHWANRSDSVWNRS
ncbi:hypothetical protein Leryth_006715 [Lithospermum erythrorhizon]|nr:hypothetical protein Leryth_006715 [Lithospermum erythrorhizon]